MYAVTHFSEAHLKNSSVGYCRRLAHVLILATAVFFAPGISAQPRVDQGVIKGDYGCDMAYEVHQPAGTEVGVTVILAHGFKRDLSTMRGWAQHWSGQGIATVIPSLCNSSWFRGRHDRNAGDLQSLRKHLELGPVIYAGYSAGGLAAYLAALDDPQAVAYLGLDAVDSGDLAAERADGLAIPALFLLAAPSACNAKNNFLPIIERNAPYTSHKIDQATHCHFEMPYDSRCAWVCKRTDEAVTASTQLEILDIATTWLLTLTTAPSTR